MSTPTLRPPTRDLAESRSDFERRWPAYGITARLDQLRACDYSRLDDAGHIYLDYTGGSLYAESQVRRHMELLTTGVFGNPHSNNPTSLAMTHLVEETRSRVLAFFRADPDEYTVVFTPNCSGALRLVGESFPFAPGSRYLLTWDNHNSVNGIREYARAKGAQVDYLRLSPAEMRLDSAAVEEALAQPSPNGAPRLFAFPAQSNFSGVQHPPALVAAARERGWTVLLDAAAFVPTNRLDLRTVQPDFVPLSFYKMFGYPTGVGALLARREALASLQRPWFAGGTIAMASVQGEGWHTLMPGEAGFEDGTVNYLALPAVSIGLAHLEAVDIDLLHERVTCLTGWLLEAMGRERHSNGAPLFHIFGPTGTAARGATVAFNFVDPQGRTLDFRQTEAMAALAGISLRTGCFCNPGAGEVAHNLSAAEMAPCFAKSSRTALHSYADLFARLESETGKRPSTHRISLGFASNFDDVWRFMAWAASLRDLSAAELDQRPLPAISPLHAALARDAA
jgi:selenocysteine lyase/cysteine desulfurase